MRELRHSPHVLSHRHLDWSQCDESRTELTVLLARVALYVIEVHSRTPDVLGENAHQFY